MRIAAITVAYNDHYKINEWLSFYRDYKNEIFLHIIVDNGSDPGFSQVLNDRFPDSIIIRRDTNMGTTAAYNEGIRYALKREDIDSIMLIGNDIRMPSGNISILYEALFNNEPCGIVMPIVFSKDSDIIESYGSSVNKLLFIRQAQKNEKINDSLPLIHEVEGVVGGINLAKREYYEIIGLQDERLFMYGDEIDMGLRMAKTNIKAMATRQAVAWHQHISPTNSKCRQGYAVFLIRRNNIYLAYKHFGFFRALTVFIVLIMRTPILAVAFAKRKSFSNIYYYLLGCFCGMCKIKRNFHFIANN